MKVNILNINKLLVVEKKEIKSTALSSALTFVVLDAIGWDIGYVETGVCSTDFGQRSQGHNRYHIYNTVTISFCGV